jgi:hypothetical protein
MTCCTMVCGELCWVQCIFGATTMIMSLQGGRHGMVLCSFVWFDPGVLLHGVNIMHSMKLACGCFGKSLEVLNTLERGWCTAFI